MSEHVGGGVPGVLAGAFVAYLLGRMMFSHVRLERARKLLHAGDAVAATRDYTAAVALWPGNRDAQSELARVPETLASPDPNALVEPVTCPPYVPAFRGIVALGLAFLAVTTGLAFLARNARGLPSLGIVYTSLGFLGSASLACQFVLDMRSAMRVRRGQKLQKENRLAEALAEYRQGGAISPGGIAGVAAYHRLGQAAAREGRLTDAIVEYRRAVRMLDVPRVTSAVLNDLSTALEALRLQLKDVPTVEAASMQAPHSPIPQTLDFRVGSGGLGAVAVWAGYFLAGATHFGSPHPLHGIAGALLGALAGILLVRRLYARRHSARARLFLLAGDAQAAIEEAREALRFNRSEAGAHVALAESLEALGERTGALMEYREVLRSVGGSSEIEDRMSALA